MVESASLLSNFVLEFLINLIDFSYEIEVRENIINS